jgi:hypothetical protein
MILITLGKRPGDTRVEIHNGTKNVDITHALTGLDLRSHLGTAITRIVLELQDDVIIIGDPGRLEFHKPGTPK